MSKDRVPRFLAQAEEKEKKYDWLEAAAFHKKALTHVLKQKDYLKAGDVQERIGYCFYRGAFQSESQEEFKEGMQRAVDAYAKAHGLYDKLADDQKVARIFRCDAMIAYMGYWLASEASEKKRLINECWERAKKSLEAFEETGDAIEYGRTFNEFSLTPFLAYVFEWDFRAGEKIIREAMQCDERAVTLLCSVGDARELAKAYVKAAFYLTAFGYSFIPDMDEKESYRQKGQGYWQKACELSEEAALLELARTSGNTSDEFGWNFNEIIEYFEKALSSAKKTEDNYMIGTALDWVVYASLWKMYGIDDPDKRVKLLQKTLQYAEDAKQHFSSISFVSPRSPAWTGAPQVWYNRMLSIWETDSKKKRDLLEKAVMYGTPALKLAESTGYPRIIFIAHHENALALQYLAGIETNFEEKRRLLEKALEHRKECVRIDEQLVSFEYWNLGLNRVLFARLKAELTNFEKDLEKRKNMLKEATSDIEHGLRSMIKEKTYCEKSGEFTLSALLGSHQFYYGELLIRLYGLTNNNEHQRKAIKAFEDAAESYQKLNMFSRMAECYWKIGTGYDALEQHLKAAESFSLASDSYKRAGEKIPQLKNFYQEYTRYMQAWSETEKARYHHAEKRYEQARKHYQNAANIHKSTEQWSYLSPNYLAWARLEEGENLSRKEQTEEAKDLFHQAAELFLEANESILANLEKIEAGEEKQVAAELAEASNARREYCLGRIAVEEAKILDRQGNHTASSRKYGVAAETFQKAIDSITDELGRRELEPIICLSRAWQLMTRAEAEASPDLYLEASKLFDEAKEHSLDEQAKVLALGHSRFCKALEAGTRFEDTRDPSLHSAAIQHLESAGNYYVKAGFKTASEYAKATQHLFDAYMYVHKAETAANLTKKAQHYQIAEKLFQASAGSYMKAKHPEKSEQVQRLLDSVKEKRQLAMSLTDVLHAPTTTSTTTSFSTPTPTHEQAVGLERFEHADIQANLILRVREIRVGEDLTVEIELVNAGKAPALLIKVEKVVPEDFEVKEVPEMYRMEDRFLNMKGRRLNPLKTEEIRLVLRPSTKGTFMLKPRIMYLDEAGKYKSHQPEPVTITVKELGIKDWIKG